MFTHINGYLNRVEYLHLHIFISTNDVKLSLNYIRQYRVYIRSLRIQLVYTHASSASRPPTGRTITPTPSLALTNGSAFGELLLLLRIEDI